MEKQTFKKLYIELAQKIETSVSAVQWIDLWNSQVMNIETEHPFPAPAVFLAFRSQGIDDIGEKAQNVHLFVDVFVFYETFADTYKGSFNQDDALKFLDIMDDLNKILHASSGENYSSMRRVAYSPIDTGGFGNLYSITYTCELIDATAADTWGITTGKDVIVERFIIGDFEPDEED